MRKYGKKLYLIMDKINEKSVSKSQQRLMGQAYAYKKGDIKYKDLNPKYSEQIKKLSDSITLKQLKDFASTKHKGLKESNILSFEMFLEKLNSNKLYDLYYNKFKNSQKEKEELDYQIYTQIRSDFVDYIAEHIDDLLTKKSITKYYSNLCKTNRNPKEDFKMILNSLSDDFKLEELKKIFNPQVDAICDSTIEDLYLKHLDQDNGLTDLFFYFLLPELGYSNEKIYLGGDAWPLCILEDNFGEDANQELMIRYKYGYHRTDYGKLAIFQAGLTIEEFKKRGVKHLVEIIDEDFIQILYKAILYKNKNMLDEFGKLGKGWTPQKIYSHIFNSLIKLIFNNYYVIEEDRLLIMTDDIKYDLNIVIDNLKIKNDYKITKLETSDINEVFKKELDIYELDITEGDLNLMIWDDFE